MYLLGGARVVIGVLDVAGIGLIGAAGAVASGVQIAIPLVGAGWGTVETLVAIVLAAAVVLLSKTVISILLTRATVNYLAKIELTYSEKIIGSLLRGPMKDFRKFSEAEVEWAVLRSSAVAFSNLLNEFVTLVAELALAVMIVAFLLYTDWIGTLGILVFFLLLLGVLQHFTQTLLSRAGSEFSEGSTAVTSLLLDAGAALKEIKVLSVVDVFVRKVSHHRRRVAESHATVRFLSALPRLILELGLVLGALLYLGFELYRNEGALDLSRFAILTFGSLRTISAILPIHRASMSIIHEAPMARSALEILEDNLSESSSHNFSLAAHEDWEPETASWSESSKDGIAVEIDSISFSHSQLQPTLFNGLSITLSAGEIVALVGPSGGGKSTLLDIALGLQKPDEGKVTYNGLAPDLVRTYHPGAVAYVPQKPGIISGTIAENVALGVSREEVDWNRLAEALAFSQLAGVVDSLPEGPETLLGAQKDNLSGGQLQRLGLARAIYGAPKFLGLDEATSALDAQTEAGVSEAIQNLRGRTTVLIVAHRISSIQGADRILFMDRGKIMASGSFVELREQYKGFRNYLKLLGMI